MKTPTAAQVSAWVAKRRKTAVAVASGLAAVVASGLLHGDALVDVNVALAVLGSLGVHAVPNAKD